MQKRGSLIALLLLLTVGAARGAAVQIADTVATPFGGVAFNGRLIISGPNMTTADGRSVAKWQATYQVSAGVVTPTIFLEPNDTATPPGTSYSVRYLPVAGAGNPWTETWLVQTSASPLTIQQVRVIGYTNLVPGLLISPQQVSHAGLSVGQVWAWGGSSYVPTNASGSGSGITTLNTLSGATQTLGVTNDANVFGSWSSAGTAHTLVLSWSGALAKARQHAATLYSDGGYADPAWLTSLAYAKITGVPSFLTAVPTPGVATPGGVLSGQCTPTTGKLMGYDSSGLRICETDQAGGGGGGITTFNTLSGATQTLGVTNDTNVMASWNSAGTSHTLVLSWSGALAKARQHANTLYSDGSYADPAWLTSVAYSKLAGVPAFATCTGDLSGTAPGCTVSKLNGASLAALSTGLLKNTTGTGAPSVAIATDIISLFSGCSGTLLLGADSACHAAGTVTSIGSTFTGGLIGVAGSPVTGAGTFAFTVAGTSGGVPYFSGASTWASSPALTVHGVMLGGGPGAAPATTAAGAAGTYLTGNGAADPTFQAPDAAALTGSLADARLSANVPLKNGTNAYTGTEDSHLATKTLPHRAATGSPVGRDSCATVGETFFQTDAAPGHNGFACTTIGTPGIWSPTGQKIITYTTQATAPVYTWLANEGSGSTFADSAGNANTITATGVSWSPNARTNGFGAYFDGTVAGISANHTAFNPTSSTAFSVSTWVSFDVGGNTEILVSQGVGAANSPGWYLYKINTGPNANKIEMILFDGTGVVEVRAANVMLTASTAGPLYSQSVPMAHIVATVDGTHQAAGVKIYINGVLGSLTTVSDNMSGSMTPNANIYIGAWAYNSGSRHRGYHAGTQLWTKVLNQTDVTALWANGPFGAAPVLLPVLEGPTVLVSQIPGVVLDCNLTTGLTAAGGACADNTTAINRILGISTASAPVKLMIDGGTATTGIHIPPSGHVTIQGGGWDTGFFVIAGSNQPCITNGFGIYPTGAVPSRGKNVELRNFKCHGNAGTYPNGNSTRTDRRGVPWISGINLIGLDGVILDDVWVYDAPSYQVNIANVGDFKMVNSTLETTDHGNANTDGLHVSGPAENVFVSHSTFIKMGDDAIALNAPETYGGVIDKVSITNVRLSSVQSAFRAYQEINALNFGVNNVVIDGMVGDVAYSTAFNIYTPGGTGGTPIDNSNSLKITNTTITGGAGPLVLLNGEWAEIVMSNVSWLSPTGANPFINFHTGTSYISSLTCSLCTIYRSTAGNAAAYGVKVPSGVTIKRFSADFHILNEQGQSYAAIAALLDVPSGGLISELYLPHQDKTRITALYTAGSGGRITTIVFPASATW